MGALHEDLSVVSNGWNSQPAPIVEPLVTYWLATADPEGLGFAKAYSEGILHGLQQEGFDSNRMVPSMAIATRRCMPCGRGAFGATHWE